MSELSRKRLLTRIKRAWIKQASNTRAWNIQAWIKDDSGAAALVVAAVIAVIAFTALTVFLNKLIGDRELARAQSGANAQARVLPAISAFYLADTVDPTTHLITPAPHRLPCPDIAGTPTGKASVAGCATAGTNYVGVIPWVDLGLSRADAVDSHGNFYTYVVSGTASGVCESITKDYAASGGSAQEFTGRLLTSTLEALSTTQVAGQGRKVPFAIIGHGSNGTGALSGGGQITGTPAKAGEQANAASINSASPPTAIFTGPADLDTTSATYFDDQVLVPTTTDVQKVCAQLTPGGSINTSVADGFNNATTTATNFGNIDGAGTGINRVTVQASGSDSTNKVASFQVTTAGGGAATSYLVTNSGNFNFDPLARAVYAKATWRAGAAGATFSVATRGSSADLTAGSDLFTTANGNGITFRFGASLEIRNGATQLATGSGLTISSGTLYTLEVYDNGSDVWMRIYPTASPSTSATIRAANATGDTTGDQQVFFINSSITATAEVDDITVGFPMLAAETTGAITSYITSTGNGTSTGRLTLEAWVRPRSLPLSGSDSAIVAKWDTAAATGSSFRLRINSSGNVYFDAAVVHNSVNASENFLGPTLVVNEWAHIAVTYTFNDGASNDSETVTFFKNGDQVSSTTSTPANPAGINMTGVPDFYVGADLNGAAVADPFNGDIADVRVWKEARTAQQIQTYFQSRLSADSTDSSIDDLVVNWRLDSESLNATAGLTFTSAAATGKGTAGTVHAASLIPALALYFRPLATSFCPGAVSGAYQCDFRIATTAGAAGAVSTLAVPSNLLSVYAKVWGAGGGGYDDGSNQSAGGSGGFSVGKLSKINSVSLYDINSNGSARLKVYVGGFGTGSTDVKNGGGGGAGSGIFDSASHVALIAGGGGGASFSSDNNPSPGGNCNSGSVKGTIFQCGLGGNGSGLTATMVNAPDDSTQCGGRAGDNVGSGSGPPSSNGSGNGNCDDGGNNNSLGNGGAAGASGGAGGLDAGANLLAGGKGADADETDNVHSKNTNNSAAGGGGGGGGAVGGESGGYDHANAHQGYGGGGGSAARDATGVANFSGAAGAYSVVTGGTFNDSATGNYISINQLPTLVTGMSKDIVAAGWTAGMNISGAGIKNGATISSINSTTSLTVTAGSGLSLHTGATLTVSSTTSAHLSSTPGGGTDFHSFPSYVLSSTYSRPGVGGTNSSSINGTAGAVVLIW